MKIKTMKKQESDFVKNSSLIVNTKTVEKQGIPCFWVSLKSIFRGCPNGGT